MGFIRIFFPQEVCHKRTRLTPTKLHRFNWIKVIESLNESTQLASKVIFSNILITHGIKERDIFINVIVYHIQGGNRLTDKNFVDKSH